MPLAETFTPGFLASVGISPKRLESAIATIRSVFSEEYLENLKKLYKGEKAYQVFKHPIYNGMLMGEVSLDTPIVIELAACLEKLKGKPNLAGIIQRLKDLDDFDDYFYQLSTAYRLSFLDPNIQMEPLIKQKTPDNVIEFGGKKCAIECTVMSGSHTYGKLEDAMHRVKSVVFSQAEKSNYPCNIHLTATQLSIVTPENVEAMKNAIREMIEKKSAPQERDLGFCKIAILPPHQRPEKAEMGMMQTWTPLAGAQELHLRGITNEEQKYTAGFFVSISPIRSLLIKEAEDRVYEKIESKRAQVKVLKDDHEIFLFIDTDISDRQLAEREKEISHEIISNFLAKDDPLFSLIVLTNRPRGNHSLFAINRMIYGEKGIDQQWLEKFWKGYMQPSVDHNFFLKTVGRNDLCPCGSGMKFKRCHGYHI